VKSQIIRSGIAAAVLVLLSAACTSTSSSSSASPSDSSTVESAGNPSTEPATGVESAKSPTESGPSLSLPSAPTGSPDTADGACIPISWLGNPIPHGDIVTITSVTVHSPFAFDSAANAQCAPTCVNYQFSAANDSGQLCYAGVSYTPGHFDSNGDDTQGNMELAGRLRCPANIDFAACQRDAGDLPRPGTNTVSFDVATIDNTSPPTSPPPQSTSSSPPESPPSSPATSGSSPAATGSP